MNRICFNINNIFNIKYREKVLKTQYEDEHRLFMVYTVVGCVRAYITMNYEYNMLIRYRYV